jgi:hypothetical protein
MRILIVEPQCQGFEHARFNSALLATIAQAFPSAQLTFWAEAQHLSEVTQLLPPLPLSAQPIDISWPAPLRQRCEAETRFCEHALDLAAATSIGIVVFSSVSSLTLLALKHLLPSHPYRGSVVAVPHGVLAGLLHRPKRVWNWPFDIHTALRRPTPQNLILVALTQTIYSHITARFDATPWWQIDHPYIFDHPVTEPPIVNRRTENVKIGLMGALRNNLTPIIALIDRIHSELPGIEFIQIGHLRQTGRPADLLSKRISNPAVSPISSSEYIRRLVSVDYALCIHEPDHHRFVASATFLDLMNVPKPALSISTPLSREYDRRFGDRGYTCASLEELASHTIQVLKQKADPQYTAFLRNLSFARRHFCPDVVAETLRQVLTH